MTAIRKPEWDSSAMGISAINRLQDMTLFMGALFMCSFKKIWV